MKRQAARLFMCTGIFTERGYFHLMLNVKKINTTKIVIGLKCTTGKVLCDTTNIVTRYVNHQLLFNQRLANGMVNHPRKYGVIFQTLAREKLGCFILSAP